MSNFARDNGLEAACKMCPACSQMVLNPCGEARSPSCDQPDDVWRDLEAAPRDGKRIELKNKDGEIKTGFWRDETHWNMEGDWCAIDQDFVGWRAIDKGRAS